VLYAHEHHNQPDHIVLAAADYGRAYAGKLASVLRTLIDSRHLVWIGFSFGDARIGAILRQVNEASGPAADPGGAPRHVALLPWDPAPDAGSPHDAEVVRNVMEIQYGCRVILYPAPGGDHSALLVLLKSLAQPRFPAVGPSWPGGPSHAALSAETAMDRRAEPRAGYLARWVHGGVPLEHFIGREEELSRLDRWAAYPEVRLIGVTAWGGAGKTSLVTEWVRRLPASRDVKGMFGWSFYEDASGERWANSLLAWAEEIFGYSPGKVRRLSARVLDLARRVPLGLVFDGLEVLQESPAGQEFGVFLDDLLRAVLTGLCQRDHDGIALLTSRFPFADLEQFDGAAARMLDVPAFTPDEGAALLAVSGGEWLPGRDRRYLVQAVDGHALAISVLAYALADQPAASDIAALRSDLAKAGRTDGRVRRVLQFYADRLTVADHILVGVVSMFARPVPVATVLALGNSDMLGKRFRAWTAGEIEAAARGPLAGLLTWHPDGRVSAHPLAHRRSGRRRTSARPGGGNLPGGLALGVGPVSSLGLHGRLAAGPDDQLPAVPAAQGHLDGDVVGRAEARRQGEGHRVGAAGLDAALEMDDSVTTGPRRAGRAVPIVGPAVHQGQSGERRGGRGHLCRGGANQRERDHRGAHGTRRSTAQPAGQGPVVVARQAACPRPAVVLILGCEHESSFFLGWRAAVGPLWAPLYRPARGTA
jgi:hypothetical protein